MPRVLLLDLSTLRERFFFGHTPPVTFRYARVLRVTGIAICFAVFCGFRSLDKASRQQETSLEENHTCSGAGNDRLTFHGKRRHIQRFGACR
jgi:hypothetical protein